MNMGRTNIVLDDRLIREGLRLFRCRSKRELVHLALTELLNRAQRLELLALRGQVKWEGNLAELRLRRAPRFTTAIGITTRWPKSHH